MPQHDPTDLPDLDRLVGVQVDVTVELGRTRMSLGDALDFGPGAVIPLDRTAGSPLALKVNGHLVAQGEVVVVDDVYALRITEIVEPEDSQSVAYDTGQAAGPLAGHGGQQPLAA